MLKFFILLLSSTATMITTTSAQAWFDDIGFTSLEAQEGVATPRGAGISVGIVEANASGTTNYTPNTASSQFTGKTITDASGTSGGVSSHATTVSTRFFGNTGSIASGITDVNVYSAGDYLVSGGLKTGATGGSPASRQPTVFTEKIMNHSYISNGFSDVNNNPLPALTAEAIKRFDYSLARDNTLGVVGLNNGSGTTVPALLAHNYNGISVGLTNGAHSTGATTIEGAGRVKPDLVAPDSLTSYATPQVSASAAVLLSSSHSTANYEQITTQKAVLMAGATKEGKAFETSWSRTDTQSLDAHYGAGEVNVHNSFNIQAAGEKAVGSSGSANHIGWDYAELVASTVNTYSFTIDPAHLLTEFSAVLTWNREVDSIDFSSATVSDLKLELTDSLGTLIQLSDSSVDNVEHIYLNSGIAGDDLEAGTYNLKVSSDVGDASAYSLAWRSEIELISESIPEPSTAMLLALASIGFITRRARC